MNQLGGKWDQFAATQDLNQKFSKKIELIKSNSLSVFELSNSVSETRIVAMLLSSIKVDLEGPDPTQNKNAINQNPKNDNCNCSFFYSSHFHRVQRSQRQASDTNSPK